MLDSPEFVEVEPRSIRENDLVRRRPDDTHSIRPALHVPRTVRRRGMSDVRECRPALTD